VSYSNVIIIPAKSDCSELREAVRNRGYTKSIYDRNGKLYGFERQLAQNMITSIDAMELSKEFPGHPIVFNWSSWKDQVEQKDHIECYINGTDIIEAFLSRLKNGILPEISGVDDWTVRLSTHCVNAICNSSFRHIADRSALCIPFTVTIPLADPLMFSLKFTGGSRSRTLADSNSTSDIIELAMSCAISNYKSEIMKFNDKIDGILPTAHRTALSDIVGPAKEKQG